MSSKTTRLGGWQEKLVIASLTLCMFAVVTLEQLPIGVLTLIADDFRADPGLVGLGVTLTGVMASAVAVCAPILMRSLDRRWALIIALGACVLSALGSTLAPNLAIWLASRLLAGVGVGIIFTVMSVIIASIVPVSDFPKVTTIVFAGISAAVVLGMPMVTYLGALGGWHLSFLVTMVLTLLPVFPVYFLLPPVRRKNRSTWKQMWRVARTKEVVFIVSLTIALVFGHFLVYSYISPILQLRAGITVSTVASLLLEFGLVALVGNFAIVPILQRSIATSLFVVNLGLTVSIFLLFFISSLPVAVVLMGVWGLFLGPVSVVCQNWNLTQPAPDDREAAQAISSGFFNLCIAGGAMIGGYLLHRIGDSGLILTGGTVVALGLVPATALFYRRHLRR